MFSYRPESVYLKRTYTSLSRYAFRRTATGFNRWIWGTKSVKSRSDDRSIVPMALVFV